jgi:hypothetical protein
MTILLSLGAIACGRVRIRKAATVESAEKNTIPDSSSQRSSLEQATTQTQRLPERGEYEGLSSLNQMSRAQTNYIRKTTPPRFSSSFSELELKFLPENESYLYRIDSVGLNYVIMSAQAKNPEFRSFTALVLSEVVNPSPSSSRYPNYPNSHITLLTCQTEQPSTTPVIFQGAITTAKDLQCPTGSTRV